MARNTRVLTPEYYGTIKIRITKEDSQLDRFLPRPSIYHFMFEYNGTPLSTWHEVLAGTKREAVAHAIKYYEEYVKPSFVITEYGAVKKIWSSAVI